MKYVNLLCKLESAIWKSFIPLWADSHIQNSRILEISDFPRKPSLLQFKYQMVMFAYLDQKYLGGCRDCDLVLGISNRVGAVEATQQEA